MSALRKALTDINFRVPPQILKAVFLPREHDWRAKPISLDEAIMARVIRPRVMVDTDITGGTEDLIDLSQLPAEQVDITQWTIRIPKNYTQNRSIIAVQGITFVRPDNRVYMTAPVSNGGALMMNTNALMMTQQLPPNIFNHMVTLIGENTILISEMTYLQPNMYLQCTLGSDENLSHVPLKYYLKFARLVELAVKSYIYNEYVVEMDIAELRGGQALGRFKEVIETYNDAEQEYQLYLDEKWRKAQMMMDKRQHARYVNSLIGSNR